jgi:SAM dependent carboxyl methyltransferase
MQACALETLKSTEGMVDYDRNSSAQQRIVRVNAGRIRGLIERLGQVRPELKIVDYGCGPGTSAIEAVAPAVEAYRARFSEDPISVCHADQPGNDWNALFALAAGPSGYRHDAKAIRTEAAVGSFYDQMVAEGSVALGLCFAASHWFSHAVRLHAPGTVWFADLTGNARAEMAAFAQADWARFLRCRALELRRGGFLLVSTLGAVRDDSEINGTAASGRGIYRALQRVAQEMADDGLLDRQTLDSFVFGLWFMTESEARAALQSDPGLAASFAIEDIKVEPAPVNHADIFAQSIGDPAAYARLYVGYTRAFADSTLRTQLFEPSADNAAGADRLAQEFYRRLENLYREYLGKYACEIWNLTVVLRRT